MRGGVQGQSRGACGQWVLRTDQSPQGAAGTGRVGPGGAGGDARVPVTQEPSRCVHTSHSTFHELKRGFCQKPQPELPKVLADVVGPSPAAPTSCHCSSPASQDGPHPTPALDCTVGFLRLPSWRPALLLRASGVVGAAQPFHPRPRLPAGTPGLVARSLLSMGHAPDPASPHVPRVPLGASKSGGLAAAHGPSRPPSPSHSWTWAPPLPTGYLGTPSPSTPPLCALHPPVPPSSLSVRCLPGSHMDDLVMDPETQTKVWQVPRDLGGIRGTDGQLWCQSGERHPRGWGRLGALAQTRGLGGQAVPVTLSIPVLCLGLRAPSSLPAPQEGPGSDLGVGGCRPSPSPCPSLPSIRGCGLHPLPVAGGPWPRPGGQGVEAVPVPLSVPALHQGLWAPSSPHPEEGPGLPRSPTLTTVCRRPVPQAPVQTGTAGPCRRSGPALAAHRLVVTCPPSSRTCHHRGFRCGCFSAWKSLTFLPGKWVLITPTSNGPNVTPLHPPSWPACPRLEQECPGPAGAPGLPTHTSPPPGGDPGPQPRSLAGTGPHPGPASVSSPGPTQWSRLRPAGAPGHHRPLLAVSPLGRASSCGLCTPRSPDLRVWGQFPPHGFLSHAATPTQTSPSGATALGRVSACVGGAQRCADCASTAPQDGDTGSSHPAGSRVPALRSSGCQGHGAALRPRQRPGPGCGDYAGPAQPLGAAATLRAMSRPWTGDASSLQVQGPAAARPERLEEQPTGGRTWPGGGGHLDHECVAAGAVEDSQQPQGGIAARGLGGPESGTRGV
nr:collagen alpha-1(X) chain-like [Vulpes vulpes]